MTGGLGRVLGGIPLPTMSSGATVPRSAQNEREHRSHAVEQGREQAGTGVQERVPALVAQLETRDNEVLLDVVSQVRDASGDYRFAESRVGRFIGGGLKTALPRCVLCGGADASPPPPGRVVRIWTKEGSKAVAWD